MNNKTQGGLQPQADDSQDRIDTSRRRSLQSLILGGAALAAAPLVQARTNPECAEHNYNKSVDAFGSHQAGVITPDQKEALFIAFKLTTTIPARVQKLFQTLSARIAFLTKPESIQGSKNDKLPPRESGFLGGKIEPDSLTVTLSVGSSLFDNRFGLAAKKPVHLVPMGRFPNDRLQKEWCGGDISIQLCANSRESVIYALRDIISHTGGEMFPLWKIDGFLPARDIDRGTTAINLFGFKDGTGNAPATDSGKMDELVWVTSANGEPDWCTGGSYQAIRLIRFNLEFWDRTPLEDQENDFGRRKLSGAPIGMKNEMDDPQMAKDPHGDRILFDSHMRRAEPRIPERHVAKLRRRSYSYSLGILPSGALDMGLIFACYQNNLKKGFIETQERLNGEPLERYIKPFGGGYYFVLPGMKDNGDYLGRRLFES